MVNNKCKKCKWAVKHSKQICLDLISLNFIYLWYIDGASTISVLGRLGHGYVITLTWNSGAWLFTHSLIPRGSLPMINHGRHFISMLKYQFIAQYLWKSDGCSLDIEYTRSRFKLWKKKNNCNKSSNRTETGLAQLNKTLHLPVEYEYIYVNINQFHSHTARHMPIPTYSQTNFYASLTKICIYIIKRTLRVCELHYLCWPLLNTNGSSDTGDIPMNHTYRSHRNIQSFLFHFDLT